MHALASAAFTARPPRRPIWETDSASPQVEPVRPWWTRAAATAAAMIAALS
jgi:hypothetical protein